MAVVSLHTEQGIGVDFETDEPVGFAIVYVQLRGAGRGSREVIIELGSLNLRGRAG